mmetsp:Transcript_68227/g.164988  ORF Transcript_68227/g.164988 Transcript_68227/m.164988 type:complete len:91 (+) Transcript_68227:707-979(+)
MDGLGQRWVVEKMTMRAVLYSETTCLPIEERRIGSEREPFIGAAAAAAAFGDSGSLDPPPPPPLPPLNAPAMALGLLRMTDSNSAGRAEQ